MKEKYLPIGSVVLLKDATKKLMITGYCSMLPANQTKIYDYVGSLFPEGNLAGEEVALFDHDQIAEVFHMGLVDDEYKEFNKNLVSTMSEDTLDDSSVNITVEQTIPTITLDNINEIISDISLKDIQAQNIEPTAFDEAKLKVPSFEMESYKSNSEEDIQEEVVEESEDTGDGEPVLQLEPIFIEEKKSDANDDSGSSTGGIFELERL